MLLGSEVKCSAVYAGTNIKGMSARFLSLEALWRKSSTCHAKGEKNQPWCGAIQDDDFWLQV